MQSQLLTIENNIILGAQIITRQIGVTHTCDLRHLVFEVDSNHIRVIQVVTEHLDLNVGATAHTAATTTGRYNKLRNLGNLSQLGTPNIGNLVDRTLTLGRTRQTEVVADHIATRLLHCRHCVVGRTLTRTSRNQLNLGEVLIDNAIDTASNIAGVLHREILLGLDRSRNLCIIRGREEVERNELQQTQRHDKQQHCCTYRRPAVAYRPSQHSCISIVQPIEELIDRLVDDTHTLIVVLTALRREDIGRQHRGQRNSRSGRHTYHDRYDPTQLLEQDTCHTRHHCQRHKYRYNYQRRCDYRQPHLIGTVDCSLFGV